MGVPEDDPQLDLKNELKQLFTKLCGKLDALCNFHYTPKAAIPEMKVGTTAQDAHFLLNLEPGISFAVRWIPPCICQGV